MCVQAGGYEGGKGETKKCLEGVWGVSSRCTFAYQTSLESR